MLQTRQVYINVCNPNFDSNLRNRKKFQQTVSTKAQIQKGASLTIPDEFTTGMENGGLLKWTQPIGKRIWNCMR